MERTYRYTVQSMVTSSGLLRTGAPTTIHCHFRLLLQSALAAVCLTRFVQHARRTRMDTAASRVAAKTVPRARLRPRLASAIVRQAGRAATARTRARRTSGDLAAPRTVSARTERHVIQLTASAHALQATWESRKQCHLLQSLQFFFSCCSY